MFDAIEQRINERVLTTFANATALINAVSINGIFDDAIAAADIGLVGMQASSPQFTCATADLPAIAEHDVIVIRGTSYRIAEAPQDEAGMTVLVLKK